MKKPDIEITYDGGTATVRAHSDLAKEVVASLTRYDSSMGTEDAAVIRLDRFLARGFALKWREAKFAVKEIGK